ncbi:hypothetical protein SAMN02745221_01544 [Thermosyntropha lipolytica DSM 11003]|uniref:Uncharacterized protein n=1 Tax=Thermosyntropha lipolytica DSM 11003 TaxID=1123382 RepID=A0A1M5PQZ0_9FIRM|nr:hypothetical protein SAMN02745221_01544 [Thermosyntropha lipolytica DSM 11003]
MCCIFLLIYIYLPGTTIFYLAEKSAIFIEKRGSEGVFYARGNI